MLIRNIHVWDGSSLVKHRRDFRKIGTRLFRVVKADLSTKGILQALSAEYGLKVSLGDVMAKCSEAKIKDKHIPATEKEIKEYNAAEATLQAHVDRAIDSRKMQLARGVVARMYHSLGELKKLGVLVPEHPMPVNVPKGVSEEHVAKLIEERRRNAANGRKASKAKAKKS